LEGKTVAFVWDYIFRGDEIFPILREALSAAYPGISFVDYDTFGNTMGADENAVRAALPRKLAAEGVDVAISGVGCCGSCTPAVIRASAAIEKAGIPTASLVCDGFAAMAHAVSPGLGIPDLPVALLPGHVDSQTDEELREMVLSHTLADVISCLTSAPKARGATEEYHAPDAIVAEGDFAAVNAFYENKGWSDGLPIVPPTLEAVRSFLEFTPDRADRVIGIVQPSGSAVSVWNVAVNGVMAGCRPEYMPVLVAIAEVLCDPGYGVEHSGDTTGGDALIVLSGSMIGELGFNRENAALRDGTRANSTVGRFLRLFLRNIAGSRPGGSDRSTFGHNFRIVLAEHEEELAKLGWTTFGQQRGFAKGAGAVTIGRFTGDTVVGSMYGRDPEVLARNLGDGLVRLCGWELVFTVGLAPGKLRPLAAISPMIAKTFAKTGVDREGLQHLLFKYARLPASKLETYIGLWSNLVPGRRTLAELHEAGLAGDVFVESEDPDRLVPIVEKPEDILVVVAGDPYRSNACVFGSNGVHGFPTSREIRWIR